MLQVIAQTVGMARGVFQAKDNSLSLMGQALHFIQSDLIPLPSSSLSEDLKLTTQALLNTLPSSTYYLLLPVDIKTYRPFVDLTSPSLTISEQTLSQKLADWFKEATLRWEESVGKCFGTLEKSKEVWEVRIAVRQWLSTTMELTEEEKHRINTVLDVLCRIRVEKIWKSSLDDLYTTFKKNLLSMVTESKDRHDNSKFGLFLCKISRTIVDLLILKTFPPSLFFSWPRSRLQ